MKKQVIFLFFSCLAIIASAQNNNCSKIKQLASEAKKNQLQKEATGDKFKTTDDFEAWTAVTILDGASKCYVQDAQVSKMYVAEFGTSLESKSADLKLSNKFDELSNMFKSCIGTGFVIKEIKSSDNIFKGFQYDGRGENLNTKISLMLVYNPEDKKQLLFISIINDPS